MSANPDVLNGQMTEVAQEPTTMPRLRPRLIRSPRRPLVRPDLPVMQSLVESATIELIPMKSLEAAIAALRPASRVSITCSPARTIEATLDAAERLVALGHRVTPHLSARMVQSDGHLRELVARIDEIGLRDVFVVAGDAEHAGAYFDAIELLEAFLALDPAVDHVGFTGYPDTHPLIDLAALHAALHRKQALVLASGRTAHVTTQMCFSPDQFRSWLTAERAAGLTVPVHLGLPGVIDRSKLMTMGMRLGVGTSLRYLSKNRKAIGKLMTQRAFQPDQLLRPLALDFEPLGVTGLHLFSFNQVATTEEWRERTLERARSR